MSCEYGYNDCIHLNTDKCSLCFDGYHYKAPKQVNYGMNKVIKVKESKRQGSINEVKTFNQIKTGIDVQGTPNSGAGSIKGDLDLGNFAMVECKTTTEKNKGRQPAQHSFSIKRDHLEKLKKEALEAKKEFHFLVFSFQEYDDDLYVVSDLENYNSMIATMKHDRTQLIKVKNEIDIYRTRKNLAEAENTCLLAEIEVLKAELKHLKEKDKEMLV